MFSLANDRVEAEEFGPERKEQWKHRKIPQRKNYRHFPAVKITRLGVVRDFQAKGYGTTLLEFIKAFS